MRRADEPAVLVRVGAHVCALPVGGVVESMRPLPTRPLAGTPACVLGVAVIRGVPAPVVDVGALLGDPGARRARWVVVRCGERAAALAVDAVLGVQTLPGAAAATPLVAGAAGGAVTELRTLDAELVLVLEAASLVPEGAFHALPLEEA
jgi:purine-binding chemotaxis protein CheW